jgi:NAD(P)H dehydrogenase (quinone)
VIVVTGATGAVGGRVARRLAERGVPIRPVARSLGVPYSDPDAMRGAFDRADVLFLVSAAEDLERVGLHRSAVDAAVDAGVGRIVYLSFLRCAADSTFTFARDHFRTEEHIRASGLPWTFLRDSIYLDYVPLFVGEDDAIRGPADDGRVAGVARDDVADVAAAVLTEDGHEGRAYDVTGPEAFTLAEAAAELSRVAGRKVRFEDETLEEARASRAPSGAPDWMIEGWVTTYAAIATGELDVVSDSVERLAGHPPRSLADFLRENPGAYAPLLAR